MSRDAAPIRGTCDPRFHSVREAFADNFSERGERGACVAVSVGGRLVVDLWGGYQSVSRAMPWQSDTLVNLFSVGKAMAALCLMQLVSDGRLSFDQRLVSVWPELGESGKGEITARCLLSHRAGLPAITELLPAEAAFDRERLVAALTAQDRWWVPDSAHGYHANTFGLLAGEVVRRVMGEPIGRYFEQAVAAPLGVDFCFGLPKSRETRVAEFVFPSGGPASGVRPSNLAPGELSQVQRIYENPPGFSGFGTVNTQAWREAEHPSANAHGNARSIAGIYAALLEAKRGSGFLPPSILAEATTEHSVGDDMVLGRSSRFGLGFQLTQPERPLGPNSASFGHFGAGGSLGFADPDADVAFGYAMATYGHRWQDPRNRALIDALYASL